MNSFIDLGFALGSLSCRPACDCCRRGLPSQFVRVCAHVHNALLAITAARQSVNDPETGYRNYDPRNSGGICGCAPKRRIYLSRLDMRRVTMLAKGSALNDRLRRKLEIGRRVSWDGRGQWLLRLRLDSFRPLLI